MRTKIPHREILRPSSPRRYRPTLECLESRLVPSTAILGYHSDNLSDGQNLSESVLTPANVNAGTFGKLLTVPLDGQVYAQPLYVPAVNITTGSNLGLHNVVYVATEFDSLYAIDAESGAVLWKDSFLNGPPGVTATVTPVPANDVSSPPNQAITPWIGITGTPVIDPSTNTIYVDSNTKEVYGGNNHYVHRLHAIDLGSGAEQFGGPYTIGDTVSNDLNTYANTTAAQVNGMGLGALNGVVAFNALRELQRPGLTLSQGVVYIAYGSHDDVIPYHGWLLGFNHAGMNNTLQMVAAFNTSPNGGRAAIWQSGGRVAADDQGNLYFETGNGSLDSTLDVNGFPSQGDYGQAFLKVAPDPTSTFAHQNINGWGLKVVDYFRPDNAAALNTGDHDLGSGAPLLVPGTNLLIGGGKLGTLYVIDRTNMGKFDPNGDHVLQELTVTPDWITPAYFNGQVYFVGMSQTGTPAETFTLSGGLLSTVPSSQSPDGYNFPASTPSISANGTLNGLVWDVNQSTGELRAYTAASYADEVYTTTQAANSRDVPDPFNKFIVPTIADGRVFLGTSDNLTIYGLLSEQPINLTILRPSFVEGQLSNAAVALATFTSSDVSASATDFSATIYWGDGSSSMGTVRSNPDGSFSVLGGGHMYPEETTITFGVQIEDTVSGDVVLQSAAIPVADANLMGQGRFSVTGTAGVRTTSQTVATFSDAGGPEALSDYTARIHWGDGLASLGKITLSGTTFTVTATHLYAAAGTYTISVVISDDGGQKAHARSTAVIGTGALAAQALLPSGQAVPGATAGVFGVQSVSSSLGTISNQDVGLHHSLSDHLSPAGDRMAPSAADRWLLPDHARDDWFVALLDAEALPASQCVWPDRSRGR